MRVVPIESVQPIGSMVRTNPGNSGISFRDLLVGEEGSPNNYGLQLVEVADAYSTPRHRHNFEQIRLMLDGSFGFGSAVQEAGSVGYFCEGTYYTQVAEGPSKMLLLQVGGPMGEGFMSRRQLRAGVQALTSDGGTIERGIYTSFDEAGKKHNQDSYEAVWEHINGRTIKYPKPQYDGPVIFRPERFPWHTFAEETGVAARSYGVFNNRGLALSGLRLDAEARHEIEADGSERLLFCLDGKGRIGESADYARWTSIGLARGEGATIYAMSASEFFLIAIPDYSVQ